MVRAAWFFEVDGDAEEQKEQKEQKEQIPMGLDGGVQHFLERGVLWHRVTDVFEDVHATERQEVGEVVRDGH